MGQSLDCPWASTWATMCFMLWKWRNISIHDSNFVRPVKPWIIVQNWVHNYAQARRVSIPRIHRASSQIQIAWNPPMNGWVCLNTDGAVRVDVRTVGCGGLIRNSGGKWLCGFSKFLRNTSAYVAELSGVHEGLKLAKEKGFSKVEMRVDSVTVANCIERESSGSSNGWSLLKQIRCLLVGDWEVKIFHVYREANKSVDCLANLACDLGSTLTTMRTLLVFLGRCCSLIPWEFLLLD